MSIQERGTDDQVGGDSSDCIHSAGLLGFTVISGIAGSLAKILLVIIFILLVIFIVRGITGYRRIGR